MADEIANILPNKAKMAELLSERWCQLEFDYDAAGVDGITQTQLESVADSLVGGETATRHDVVAAYLARGHNIRDALTLFGKSGEGNAYEWLRDRCAISKRQATDCLKVFHLFAGRPLGSVAKFAPTTLVFLSKYEEHPRFISNALALASSVDREIPLSIVRSWLDSEGEPKDEVTFGINTPTDFEGAKAWVLKKVTAGMKRWPDELVDEAPDILRAAADELNGKHHTLDSCEDDEAEDE